MPKNEPQVLSKYPPERYKKYFSKDHATQRTISLPFLMTSDVEVELWGPEVSLISGLEGVGGLWHQEVIWLLWEGRKLVGWEQF